MIWADLRKPAAIELGAALEAQKKIFGERAFEQQAFVKPVLGNHRDAELANFQRCPMRHVLPKKFDRASRAALRIARMQHRLQQLALAVAFDPGDAHDLAAPDRELELTSESRCRLSASAPFRLPRSW